MLLSSKEYYICEFLSAEVSDFRSPVSSKISIHNIKVRGTYNLDGNEIMAFNQNVNDENE